MSESTCGMSLGLPVSSCLSASLNNDEAMTSRLHVAYTRQRQTAGEEGRDRGPVTTCIDLLKQIINLHPLPNSQRKCLWPVLKCERIGRDRARECFISMELAKFVSFQPVAPSSHFSLSPAGFELFTTWSAGRLANLCASPSSYYRTIFN